MTAPKRYAVPMEQLDAVKIPAAEQVQEDRTGLQHPDASAWGGSLIPAYGDGGSNDAGGD